MIDHFMRDRNWKIIDRMILSDREGKYVSFDDFRLSVQSTTLLSGSFSTGIYLHQKEAIKSFLEGENICIATGTASGKSLPFYVAAIEKLVANPKAKVIAIYPLKALGREQEERWIQALNTAKAPARVGRIDGQTPMHARMDILRNCQVLIMTPDIIHAWLLFYVGNKSVMNFLASSSLVIVDEVHNYTGVFGSNAAYLFRRMRHIMNLLGASPQFITASATIAAPENHLQNLFGLDFQIIDSRFDTSPRQETTITLVDLPAHGDLLTSLSELMDYISRKTSHKFITFVDSRKQAEYLASIVSRFQAKDGENEDFIYDNHLEKLNILPYRAGYEEHDRRRIQERLSEGTLAGIISTSALELGLDIPYLTLGILVGAPYSATSFYQRIGRIGRHARGEIIIINGGDIHSASIFQNPQQLLNMPLSEGALYLENARVQYIHALCLARHGGENDRICSYSGNQETAGFKSDIPWPKGFMELCKAERIGEISPEYQAMKAQAGDDPHHAFPLRDVEIQFQVKHKKGSFEEGRGSLSYSQLMREAYPGGVYYYTTRAYRVCRINFHRRTVDVRHEKKYTTKPQMIPTLVFPNLTAGNVYIEKKYGDLIAVESTLQIRETIIGYKEHRGPNETSCVYPLDPTGNIYFDLPRFTRNFFTTGVTFTHPSMKMPKVKNELIAQLLFEAFLMALPFERRDIHFASDRHRVHRRFIDEDAKFVAIYDQTYGSLRLSSRILEDRTLDDLLEKMAGIMNIRQEELDSNVATVIALEQILACLHQSPEIISMDTTTELSGSGNHLVRVILPGSKGLNLRNNNEEYFVESVFYSPQYRGLAYRGCNYEGKHRNGQDVKNIIPASSLVEIPGESSCGLYNLETGELTAV